MAGRGRRGGRGRGSGFSFPIESVFGRGETLPPPIAQPPALFPPHEFKPVPLVADEEQDYLLNLKQELRGTLCDSGFYIQPVSLEKDIDRYSDKYQQGSNNDIKWDWNRFPKELKPVIRNKKRPVTAKPIASKKTRKNVSERDITSKLEQLESAEKATTSDDEQEDEEKNNEEVDRDDEEYYDEEEQEEGTDYIADYFDNGEDYLDEDDNMDDGPTY